MSRSMADELVRAVNLATGLVSEPIRGLGNDSLQLLTRNFAIDLLQRLNMDPHVMAGVFLAHARERRGPALPDDKLYVTEIELEELCRNMMINSVGRKLVARSERMSIPSLLNLNNNVKNLFQAIDVAETGTLTWDQLLCFLIEATMKGRVGCYSDIHSYNITDMHTVNEVTMGRMTYVHEVQKVMVGCDGGVRLTDPKNPLKYEWVPVPGKLLCCACIPEYRMLASASPDLTIRFVDMKSKKVKASIRCDESQVSMAWSKRSKTLLTASRSGTIASWSLKFTRDGERDVPADMEAIDNPNVTIHPYLFMKTQPHESPVQDIMVLPLNGRIVSASLDPKLIIQDPSRGDVIVSFGGHKAGLLSVGFSKDNGLLLAGGFQREVMAWPVSSGRHHPLTLLDKLSPHVHPVINIHAVDGTAQVISFDTSGMVKVWDIRTLKTMQTIQSKDAGTFRDAFQSMAFIPEERKVIINTKKQFVFCNYCHNTDNVRNTADGTAIAATCYFPESQLIMTAAARRIRLWNLSKGMLCTAYEDVLTETDSVSAAAVDANSSMLYLGTHKGYIKMLTTCNGALLATISACASEEIHYLKLLSSKPSSKYLIGTGWGGSVFVFSLKNGEMKKEPIEDRVFYKEMADAKAAAFSESLMLIALGRKGTVSLWKASTRHDEFSSVNLHTIHTGSTASVTCITMAPVLNLIFVGAGQCTLQAYYYDFSSEQSPIHLVTEWEVTKVHLSLSGVECDSVTHMVYISDELGWIHPYYVGMLSDYLSSTSWVNHTAQFDMTTVVPPVHAHPDGVLSVVVVSDPYSVVISTGHDTCVRLWTPYMQPVGFLDPYKAGGGYAISEYLLSSKDNNVDIGGFHTEPQWVPKQKTEIKSPKGLNKDLLSMLPDDVIGFLEEQEGMEKTKSKSAKAVTVRSSAKEARYIPKKPMPRRRQQFPAIHDGLALEMRCFDRADQCLRSYAMPTKADRLGELQACTEGMSLYDVVLKSCIDRNSKNDTILSRTMRKDRLLREQCRLHIEAKHRQHKKQQDQPPPLDNNSIYATWNMLQQSSNLLSPRVAITPPPALPDVPDVLELSPRPVTTFPCLFRKNPLQFKMQ